MALLKALVIGMGILIVLAMAMLAYGLISKTGSKQSGDTPSPAAVAAFGNIVIPDAVGCRIEDATTDANRLIVTLGGTGDCRRVVVVDMAGGEIAGTVRVQP